MSQERIKAAREEIGLILQKHDLAGMMVIASETELQPIYALEASWTCLFYNDRGELNYVEKAATPEEAATLHKLAIMTISLLSCLYKILRIDRKRCGKLMADLMKSHNLGHATFHAWRTELSLRPNQQPVERTITPFL